MQQRSLHEIFYFEDSEGLKDGHAADTLDLFFTSNPQNSAYTVSSPLGSSNHCTVSVSSSLIPPPPIPPTQHHLWHFENARHADV